MKRPTKYRVVITISPTKKSSPQLKMTLDDIPRESILAPDYGVPTVTTLVKQFEESIEWEDA